MATALLALDAGGSTTRAVLIDRRGRCLGRGTGPGGNPGSNPPERAAAALLEAARAALDAADTPGISILLVLVAMAGPRGQVADAMLTDGFRQLGLAGPILYTGDLHALLASVTPSGTGYCVVCGTGAGAARMVAGRIVQVADAAGWLLGDSGSGFWLGREAVRAATADLEGRGPPTALTAAILADFSIPAHAAEMRDGRAGPLRHLIERVYSEPPIALARLAPLVIANHGDAVAARLIEDARRYLLMDFQQVFDPALPGPVALGGSVIAHLPGVSDGLADVIRMAGHRPDIHLIADGTLGAAVLALQAAGQVVDATLFSVLRTSVLGSGPALRRINDT